MRIANQTQQQIDERARRIQQTDEALAQGKRPSEITMKKYRKKPIVIEAMQWFPGVEHPGVHLDMGYATIGGRGHGAQTFKQADRPHVITIHEQKAFLEPGDWILPEPKEGRFYPCKPDIFAATYEEVN